MPRTPELYREDLAFIHDAGFGDLAVAAGGVLLEQMQSAGLTRGLVIDLGCGSGLLSAQLAGAGFEVLGIDLSPAMLALARERVPGGQFRQESIFTAELPPCVAVAAVGEILNYEADPAVNNLRRRELFGRIHAALARDGIFLLDVAGPERFPPHGKRSLHRQGDGWAVLVDIEGSRAEGQLIRRITSFRRVGKLYRRDHEVHKQHLLPRTLISQELREAGFRVRSLRSYGTFPLPRGLTAFVARRA